MAGLPSRQQVTTEQLLRPLHEAITHYDASSSFCCGGSIERLYGLYLSSGTHYGDFTSKRTPLKCAPVTIRWDGKGGTPKKLTFDTAQIYRDQGSTLGDLVQDCEPATFGSDGKDVFDETVRKAGKLEAYEFSTNFNPYDYGIVDTLARELLPGIVRAGKQPAIDHWGVVAELYKLNVYSSPSGMFKPHIDTPRGRTQFRSLVVCLPTDFEGGQLRVTHNGKEQVFSFRSGDFYSDIEWAAFCSDCEHEVLPVTSGHRVTLTYQLYVSEHVGGLAQPNFRNPDSNIYPLYRIVNDMLYSRMFMSKGGILGFHCTYRYSHRVEGTHYYERYPLALKGTDAVLFSLFRALGWTVHIRAFDGSLYRNIEDTRKRSQGLISPRDYAGDEFEPKDVSATTMPNFEHSHYVGDEIFLNVTWIGKWAANEGRNMYHEVARPVTNWIGNETEIEWEYTFLALLIVVPEFAKRELRE